MAPQNLEVKITDDIAKGVYANSMQVMHTPEEFVLDFMNILPPNAVVTSRVIISPGHLKRIISALTENIAKYEQSFGNIKLPEAVTPADSSVTTSESHKIGFKA